MPGKDPSVVDHSGDAPLSEVTESHIESSGEFVVQHQPEPPKGPPGKQIHPRRRLPPVPETENGSTGGGTPDN